MPIVASGGKLLNHEKLRVQQKKESASAAPYPVAKRLKPAFSIQSLKSQTMRSLNSD